MNDGFVGPVALLGFVFGRLEHSEPEQVASCSAIHLALDELEPVDVLFYLTLAPRGREGASTASRSLAKWLVKPANAVVFAASKPRRKCCEIALPDEPEELLGKLCGGRDLRRSLVDLFKIAPRGSRVF